MVLVPFELPLNIQLKVSHTSNIVLHILIGFCVSPYNLTIG